MAKKIMKGVFITFEGPEGSGKSTHSKLLCEYLKQKALSLIHIREPGGTKISEGLRKILLDPENKEMDELVELVLYIAARKQLVQEVVKPALKKGNIVVCDRFQDATFVYQGYALGINLKTIKQINKLVDISMRPDLTILLDLPTKEGLRRAGVFKDRLESRSYSYHRKVRRGYLLLAKKEPDRIKVIHLEKNIEATQKKIRELVDKCLLAR